MGEAKAKRERAKEVEGMSFPEQMQHYASKAVREAKFLIDNGAARWMLMETEDGTTLICLVFPSSSWELEGDRLKLKNEPNKIIAIE